MRAALRAAWTWGEMIKFSHTLFALPLALLAAFLAARPDAPGVLQFVLILACMVGARSAAMTFNRIADATIDARNPRTAARAIPRGTISRRSAWAFFAAAGGLFLLGCAGFFVLATPPNPWPLVLSIPVLAVLCGYSYAKRFTQWSHLVLGGAIALAPVAAWIAISPATLGPPAWMLMLAGACWIGGFDVIYACQDESFDRSAGLYSLPARLGTAAALWIARGLHALTVAGLVGVGLAAGLGVLYFIGVGCVAMLLVIENALVSPRDLSRVNLAFFTVNGAVGLILGGLGIADICLRRGAVQ